MELREKIADVARKLDYDYPLADELADAILALPEIREALSRKCDLCDETDKDTLRCNGCALIMASEA